MSALTLVHQKIRDRRALQVFRRFVVLTRGISSLPSGRGVQNDAPTPSCYEFSAVTPQSETSALPERPRFVRATESADTVRFFKSESLLATLISTPRIMPRPSPRAQWSARSRCNGRPPTLMIMVFTATAHSLGLGPPIASGSVGRRASGLIC
mmetsp:Transcript_139161/g.444643  ORF Transcript_139161/g.444643 Transcript_139161/m.444643 type:complete len:153 (-) Transcript_139161:708-1166(-)